MPTGKHLSGSAKAVISAGALVAIIVGAMVALGSFNTEAEPATVNGATDGTPAPGTPFLEPAPTDTVEVGAIDAVGTGQGQSELWLVQKKGETVTNTRLVLDDHSYCTMGSGGLPCMAMSVTYSTAFGGRRALVDGTTQGDTILVRRLTVMEGDEMPRLVDPGSVYIPWVRATDMIRNCEAASLMQTHEGLVHISTNEGKKYVSVEPVIDEVFTVANESTAACGNVQLGTE